MATQYANGKIVTDGLVLALDAADRNSYVSGSLIWNDMSGNAYTGSLVNGPSFSSGSGGSIVFDGVDDYANLGNILNYTLENFSFSYWVNFNSLTTNQSGNGPVILYKGSYLENGYYDQITNGAVTFLTNQSGVLQFTNTNTGIIAIQNWYNIAHTRNGSSIKIYVNGTDATLNAGTHINPAPSTNNFTLSLYNNPLFRVYGNTRVSQFLNYNRALSSQEVLQNYNAQKSRFGLK